MSCERAHHFSPSCTAPSFFSASRSARRKRRRGIRDVGPRDRRDPGVSRLSEVRREHLLDCGRVARRLAQRLVDPRHHEADELLDGDEIALEAGVVQPLAVDADPLLLRSVGGLEPRLVLVAGLAQATLGGARLRRSGLGWYSPTPKMSWYCESSAETPTSRMCEGVCRERADLVVGRSARRGHAGDHPAPEPRAARVSLSVDLVLERRAFLLDALQLVLLGAERRGRRRRDRPVQLEAARLLSSGHGSECAESGRSSVQRIAQAPPARSARGIESSPEKTANRRQGRCRSPPPTTRSPTAEVRRAIPPAPTVESGSPASTARW